MRMGLRLAAAVAAACLSTSGAGSSVIGICALVDKVSFEPGVEHPERIQISGTFCLPDYAGSYTQARKGYLYFSLPVEQADLALRAWADLKSVAGTSQVVAFGRYSSRVSLRKEGLQPESPDPWPDGNIGLVKLNSSHPRAKELLEYKEK